LATRYIMRMGEMHYQIEIMSDKKMRIHVATHLNLANKSEENFLDGIPTLIAGEIYHTDNGIYRRRFNQHKSNHRETLFAFLPRTRSSPECACDLSDDEDSEENVERDIEAPIGGGEPHDDFGPYARSRPYQLRDEEAGASCII
jgi:hypothetical protein